MNVNDLELWGGAVLIVVSAALLTLPVVLAFEFTGVFVVAGIAGLVIGATLIGLSQRGRAA